jgi:signal transduction histidine kinase
MGKAVLNPAGGVVDGRLLSRIAHDLRAPIGIVRGALSEIDRSRFDLEEQTMLKLADRGLERMLRLAEKLSLSSRILRGELALAPGPTTLWSLVEPALERARRIDGRSEVAVDVRPPNEDVKVFVDEAATRLAVVEILSNALRYAEKRVEVSATLGDLVTIRIADDGPGPEEARAWLVGDKNAAPSAGLGLGLRLAAAVLGAQGGDLTLERSAEGGTEAFARIPRFGSR